ncbi:MAG TPA: hypothetical protein VGN84_02505 [Solirubrobacterales bacterium]|nr:hypothetical protein [Solirubrobacterales bacterium]
MLAAAVAVTPSFAGSSIAGSFITKKAAGQIYVTNKKASTLYLKKKAANNTFVTKADAPLSPVVGIAAGTAPYGPSGATTAGYIPTAFTSFATPGTAKAVITFSGSATCVAAKPTIELACPIQILVDGQTTGKVNFAPATATAPAPAALTYTVMQTTVLQKGGHTVAIQYAGAKNVVFTLKNWNLAVQAYPERPEELPTETTSTAKAGK